VHAAPPVRVSLDRCDGWAAFVGICVAVASGNAVAWALLAAELDAALPIASLVALLAGTAAAWYVRRTQSAGELRWDGARWHWLGQAGRVGVALDLGAWLLLRFEPDAGARRWFPASQARTGGAWVALRAALYSAGPADSPDVPPA
jgi:hypothetical protein